jgi:protein-tyrosine phosphatase
MSWAPRRIELASVANLRDLGGAPVEGGGAIRDGVLFRSTQLASASDADCEALAALNLGLVVDLRGSYEVEAAPDRSVGAEYVWLDVLRDSTIHSLATTGDLFSAPQRFQEFLADGTAVAFMKQAYLEMVDLPSARHAYATWLRDVPQRRSPVLVHCTNGKDRTGWAIALALLAVGVSREAVFEDYLTTNDQFLPALGPLFEEVAAQGVDPDLLIPVLGVREEYLTAALDRVDAMGGLEAYFEVLGIGDEHRQALADWLIA